jgi:hypothetical protein
MPRGGQRPGAGRKPIGKRAIVLRIGSKSLKQVVPEPLSPVEVAGLLDPPPDLDKEAEKVWRKWAPSAIEQSTLVPATLSGFRELCEQMTVKRALWLRMCDLGIATSEADRLLKRYEKMAQRVDSSLARFRLTPFGKAVDSGAKVSPASNPWARIVGKA